MSFEVRSLPGLTKFADVHQLQKELVLKRIADEIPDTLLFCEHSPVITRGRGLQFRPDRVERSRPLMQIPAGTDYVEIERGGDLTWHGPGQLVMYPIVKLGGTGELGQRVGQDIDRWIRFLEQTWIRTFREFGVETFSKPGGSGVWVHQAGIERKLTSVGIALSKWVSYHGTATNIVNDLSSFQSFDPCGYNAEVMTRAKDFDRVPVAALDAEWRTAWEEAVLQQLRSQ